MLIVILRAIKNIIFKIQCKIAYFISPTFRILRGGLGPNCFLVRAMQWHIAAMMQHQQIFSKYKNIYAERELVIIGSGPTLSRYNPIPNAIHIGVNKTFKAGNIKLDYLFIVDYLSMCKYQDDIPIYCGPDTKLFYGLFQEGAANSEMIIPEYLVLRHKAERFYCQSALVYPPFNIALNLCAQPLMDNGSGIFYAVQFALYTNPRKIYLVGCDCSTQGYFDGETQNDPWAEVNIERTKTEGWPAIKVFAEKHYPLTEIISINPVGLKGLFKDIYTEE